MYKYYACVEVVCCHVGVQAQSEQQAQSQAQLDADRQQASATPTQEALLASGGGGMHTAHDPAYDQRAAPTCLTPTGTNPPCLSPSQISYRHSYVHLFILSLHLLNGLGC